MANPSDRFIFWGSPKATFVQRVGIALHAAMFFSLGAVIVYLVWAETANAPSRAVALLLAMPFLAIGLRLSRNVFLRKPGPRL